MAERKDAVVFDRRSNPRLRHALLPALIFVVVALASVGAALALWRSADGRDRARFEAESRVAGVAIYERMERQVALLRGAAGLFAATEAVEVQDFVAYVDRLGLAQSYPGVLGIGYGARLTGAAERDAFVTRMRLTSQSGFTVRPEGTRADYHPIVFLAPLDRRNRNAIGFDMATDPTWRAAMLRARDTGAPAATGRLLLARDLDGEEQAGFVVFLPVFEGGRVPVTAAARAERLQGFVYSPLRARDLWDSVFGEEVRAVDVAIYDRAVSPANLLYATGRLSPGSARFYEETPIEIAGHSWIFATWTRTEFSEGSQRSVAAWAGVLGVLGAIALALAAWAQGRAALAAERARADLRKLNETLEMRVEERTSEVSTANAGLRQEIERRQGAEEQVRQMQKMEAVGQLTGGIAHDFNNMLAIVIGSLDMAKRRTADPARVERLIDNAMEGATRAATLTQRLLAFSRRQPLNPETIDVNRLVAGMSELLRRTLGEAIRLETRLAGGLWSTYADAGQLENAIVNLAVNARDAMPGGGSLTIDTANRTLDAAHADAYPGVTVGDYVMIAVADTGEGMAPDVLAKAFDPFFTTKEVGKGTGLGLSQVFGYLRQSDGHVEIESVVGTGTAVKLFLPRHVGAAQLPLVEATSSTRLPRGSSDELILVVEDEDQVRLMSVEALRDLGYTVIHANGGAEALRKLRDYPGVRLLFTDVVMPEMNGRELADAALVAAPDLKLLFTTGYTRDATGHNGHMIEGIDLMAKPFTFEQLANKVRAVLDT